jgi:two-component system, LytTR family, response regulator
MEILKILIADDEQEARELILHYLDNSGIAYKALQAADGLSALKLLEEENPDILFLDIKMPELNGIEVLQRRQVSPLPAIIFTTAFDEFAIPAFEYEATDYLLKPFEKERFDKALEKAIKYIRFLKIAGKSPCLEVLTVKSGTRTIIVPVNEIESFQSDGAYVQITTTEKSWLMNNPLYELEARLDPNRFLRIHKSAIVNTAAVKEINSLPNGDCIIKLRSGKELRGSRTYKLRIREIFDRK